MNNVLEAIRLADRWVEAWNRRDLRGLLAMYADAAEFHSPFVTLMPSVRGAALKGKAALTTHFEASWAVGPRSRMALEDVHLSPEGVTLDLRGGCAPRMTMAFTLNSQGLIERTVSRLDDDQPRRSA